MIKPYTIFMLIALAVPMYNLGADGSKNRADDSYWSYLGWGSAATTDKRVQNWIKQAQDAIDQSVVKALDEAVEQLDKVLQQEGPFDQAIDRTRDKLKDTVGKIFDEAIEQLDTKVLQQEGPLDQAIDRTRDKLKDTVGKILDEAIEQLDTKVLQQEGPLDQAIDRARNKLKDTAQQVLADDVRPLGQDLIMQAAQNLGKMALSSTMGLFGAVTAYKGLIHALEAKRQAYQAYAHLHSQQAKDEKNTHHDSTAHFLSAKIQKLGSFAADEGQQAGAIIAGAGITSFAAACMLCCYWIR